MPVRFFNVTWKSKESRDVLFVMAMLGFALTLRIIFMLMAGVNAALTGDEFAYQQIAVNVASARGFWQDNNPFFPHQILYAWQAPAYPLSLAAIYFMFGQRLLLAKLFGVLISTATVYLTYDVARRVFQDTRVAFASGLLLAVYPGLLTNAHVLLSETLFAFCVMGAFDLVARGMTCPAPRRRSAFGGTWLMGAAGLAWGLATLTRGITLYFGPVLALWIAWMVRRSCRAEVRAGVTAGAIFLAGMATVIAPWTIRNYATFHQFVLLETKGGVNFWLGNSPDTPHEFIRDVWKMGVRESILAPLPSGEVQRDRAAYAMGMAYIAREPVAFLARMPGKFADLWGFERNLSDVAESTRQGLGWHSPIKLVADALAAVVYMTLMVAALFGLALARDGESRDAAPRWKLLLVGFVAYSCVTHLVVFGDGRFHLPLIPVLALYGGWWLARLPRVTWSRPAIAWGTIGTLVFGAIWLREGVAAWHVLTK